jgi:hypothetical protein
MEKIESINEYQDGKYKLRDISKMNSANDGTRTLFESVLLPEIVSALKDWAAADVDKGVIIGGIAISQYIKPRMTMDIDVLFLSPNDIPENVSKFKRHRQCAFQHNKTRVEIEVVTPKTINMEYDVVKAIIDTSVISDGIRIASPSGLVASKLFRFNRRDQSDIEDIIQCSDIDLSPYNLPKEQIDRYYSIKNDI